MIDDKRSKETSTVVTHLTSHRLYTVRILLSSSMGEKNEVQKGQKLVHNHLVSKWQKPGCISGPSASGACAFKCYTALLQL